MRISRLFTLIMIMFGVVLVSSCSKSSDDDPAPVPEQDTTKPQLTVNSPVNEAEFNAGDAIAFEATFTDNKALGGYKIVIQHVNNKNSATGQADGAWSYENTWSFGESITNESVSHTEIVIPEEVDGMPTMAGNYDFTVTCFDMAGNEESLSRNLILLEAIDETAPVITLSLAPEENQAYIRADTIRMAGNLVDDGKLSELLVAIMRSNATEDMVNTTDAFVIMLNANEQVSGLYSYFFNASILVGAPQDNNVPPRDITWARGNYYLIVKAIDETGNIAFSEHYPIVIQ